MRLALSSAAAPKASFGELLDAATRRDFVAVELVEGHGHGLDPGLTDPRDAADAVRRAAAVGIGIAAYRIVVVPERDDATPSLWALGSALDAPILVPVQDDDRRVDAAARRAARTVTELESQGVDAMPVLPAGPTALRAASLLASELAPGDGGPRRIAWDADPAAGDVARTGSALLAFPDVRLELIGLRGGGPEAAEQEGRGVGSLMARLAMDGFAGTVSLSPSSERYRVIWDAWLRRRRGWGCGSTSEDRTLVTLGGGR